MAKEIPVLGGIFEKVADIFSFGKLPEDETAELFTVEGEAFSESEAEIGGEELYQKNDGGVTLTLTEEYASNQAIYVGIRVENEEGFPEMVNLFKRLT